MDRMKKEQKNNDSLEMKRALRALASSQGRLLQAYFSLHSSYKVPPDTVESWDHFLAKNQMVNELDSSIDSSDISSELGIGNVRFDVLAKIGGEYVIVEAETYPPECIKKMERIKKVVNDLVSGELGRSIDSSAKEFLRIKRQLEMGKPLRVIFAVTRNPIKSTLENIKKAEDARVHPEVYYVNPLPEEGSFEVSIDLLQSIGQRP